MVSADAYAEAINGIVNLLDPHRVGQRCGLTTPSVAAKYKPPRSPVGMSSHVVGLSFGFPESCREGEEGRSERGGPVPYEAMGQGGRALAQLAMPHGSSPARGHFRMLRSHARVDVGSLLVLFKRRPCRGPRITLGVTKSVI